MKALRYTCIVMRNVLILGLAVTTSALGGMQTPTERTERFDRDPGWDARNNRPDSNTARIVRQDFGYSVTHHAGRDPGEIGGWITPAAGPAYAARKIAPCSFEQPLAASGTLLCSGRKLHALLGFFNCGGLNEWRTPNTIAIRLQGRGDCFYAYIEYATRKWRAGGDSPGGIATIDDPETGKKRLKGFSLDTVYKWSIQYDPMGNGGTGSIKMTIGDQTSVCNLSAGHKQDGAEFNRFGLLNVMKSAVSGGEVWIGDVAINGKLEDFRKDPHWDESGNRRTYKSTDVRPQGDFGYSSTQFAGGQSVGELGGLIFRGDCRYEDKLACYGDRLPTLTLIKPLKALGRVSLRRGVSDSATLIGFYNSVDSMSVGKSQESILPRSFLGVCIEGPSREGFLFYPVYRTHSRGQGSAKRGASPPILPNGAAHTWNLTYLPEEGDGRGRVTVSLDNKLGLGGYEGGG